MIKEKTYTGLPKECWVKVESTNELVLIERGKRGHLPAYRGFLPARNDGKSWTAEHVEELNAYNGITYYRVTAGAFRNVRFTYKYKFVNGKAQFTDVSNYDSYFTGIHDIDWLHKQGSKTYSTVRNTKDRANITVSGVYVLGVIIAGYPAGFRWNGTWNCSLTLT